MKPAQTGECILRITHRLGRHRLAAAAVLRQCGIQRPAQFSIAVCHIQAQPGTQARLAMLGADFKLSSATLHAFAQDDVDAAGNCLRTEFSCRAAINFYPLNQLRRQAIDRKTRWHRLAINHDLGITGTQATHTNFSANHRNTGLPF